MGFEFVIADTRPRPEGVPEPALGADASMTSVRGMVDETLRAARRDGPFAIISVIDHANTTVMTFGSDVVTVDNFHEFADEFARLRAAVIPGGLVHFGGCQAGQNVELLRRLASTIDRPVVAGNGYQYVEERLSGRVGASFYMLGGEIPGPGRNPVAPERDLGFTTIQDRFVVVQPDGSAEGRTAGLAITFMGLVAEARVAYDDLLGVPRERTDITEPDQPSARMDAGIDANDAAAQTPSPPAAREPGVPASFDPATSNRSESVPASFDPGGASTPGDPVPASFNPGDGPGRSEPVPATFDPGSSTPMVSHAPPTEPIAASHEANRTEAVPASFDPGSQAGKGPEVHAGDKLGAAPDTEPTPPPQPTSPQGPGVTQPDPAANQPDEVDVSTLDYGNHR